MTSKKDHSQECSVLHHHKYDTTVCFMCYIRWRIVFGKMLPDLYDFSVIIWCITSGFNIWRVDKRFHRSFLLQTKPQWLQSGYKSKWKSHGSFPWGSGPQHFTQLWDVNQHNHVVMLQEWKNRNFGFVCPQSLIVRENEEHCNTL